MLIFRRVNAVGAKPRVDRLSSPSLDDATTLISLWLIDPRPRESSRNIIFQRFCTQVWNARTVVFFVFESSVSRIVLIERYVQTRRLLAHGWIHRWRLPNRPLDTITFSDSPAPLSDSLSISDSSWIEFETRRARSKRRTPNDNERAFEKVWNARSSWTPLVTKPIVLIVLWCFVTIRVLALRCRSSCSVMIFNNCNSHAFIMGNLDKYAGYTQRRNTYEIFKVRYSVGETYTLYLNIFSLSIFNSILEFSLCFTLSRRTWNRKMVSSSAVFKLQGKVRSHRC